MPPASYIIYASTHVREQSMQRFMGPESAFREIGCAPRDPGERFVCLVVSFVFWSFLSLVFLRLTLKPSTIPSAFTRRSATSRRSFEKLLMEKENQKSNYPSSAFSKTDHAAQKSLNTTGQWSLTKRSTSIFDVR
jgi:hypothetical protein